MIEVLVDSGVLEVIGLILGGCAEGCLVGGVLLGLGGDCSECQRRQYRANLMVIFTL